MGYLTVHHWRSTNENPKHERCTNTWCKFAKAQLNGETYYHKASLPEAVCEVIEPIYKKRVKRCLHRRTQNPN